MDWHRKKKREGQHIEYPGELPEAEAPTPTPQETLTEREEIEALQKQIESLPPRYRQVIKLRSEGKSYRQIAEESGLTEKQVKNAIYKTKQKIKKIKNNWRLFARKSVINSRRDESEKHDGSAVL